MERRKLYTPQHTSYAVGIIRKGSIVKRGTIRSKLNVGLYFFFSAHHLMKLCICTKFHKYILNGFQDVRHKIYISDGFENDTV